MACTVCRALRTNDPTKQGHWCEHTFGFRPSFLQPCPLCLLMASCVQRLSVQWGRRIHSIVLVVLTLPEPEPEASVLWAHWLNASP